MVECFEQRVLPVNVLALTVAHLLGCSESDKFGDSLAELQKIVNNAALAAQSSELTILFVQISCTSLPPNTRKEKVISFANCDEDELRELIDVLLLRSTQILCTARSARSARLMALSALRVALSMLEFRFFLYFSDFSGFLFFFFSFLSTPLSQERPDAHSDSCFTSVFCPPRTSSGLYLA